MADPIGPVTVAVLSTARDIGDDRALAGQVCTAFAAGLDVDGASMSLLAASAARETLCATDETAAQLEELQFSLGEGAGMTAATTGRPVLVPDLDDPAEVARWPVFAAAAQQAGVGALFALPLQWGAVGLGVLELYRRAPGSLPGRQLRDALAAADVTALMLLGLRTDPGNQQWLDHSAGLRTEIHQATGMVLVQLGLTAIDALARLRAHAFAEQRTLDAVAGDVVTRRLSFAPETV